MRAVEAADDSWGAVCVVRAIRAAYHADFCKTASASTLAEIRQQ